MMEEGHSNVNTWGTETLRMYMDQQPITVTARSKAWTVFASSNAGIVGSNPAQGMDVCIVRVYSVSLLLCV
jgi:hypothetical protein